MLPLTALLLAPLDLGAAVPTPQASGGNPCGQIIDLYTSASRPGQVLVLSNAELAHNCLSSLPFHSDLAKAFLSEFRKYLNFQSTIEILDNPPNTYLAETVDLLGGFDNIEKKVSAKGYESHYEFEIEVNALINSANDGHLFVGLCTQSIFSFSTGQYRLASVSTDGTDLPELYLALNKTLLGSKKPSPITAFNGQNPADYLKAITESQSSQDPDARYNSLFPSYAHAGPGAVTIFPGTFSKNLGLWPGSDTIKVDLEDKSVVQINISVGLAINRPEVITDAESLFQYYCVPTTSHTETQETALPETSPEPSAAPSSEVAPAYVNGPLGYPEPEFRDDYNQVNGYYLDNETAVLLIPDFNGPQDAPDDMEAILANLSSDFIHIAAASGHSKLIIDLSGNGGGYIVRAFTLFKILFPNEFAYSATRFRRHDAAGLLSKILGTVDQTTAAEGIVGYAYRGAVTPDQESDFSDLSSFLTSNTEHGVPVSALHANFNYTALSYTQTPVYGYGRYALNNQTAPFAAENILIITDGYCASTCTTFVNLMTNVASVRSVVFGGRPLAAPMQIMGGVRGAQAAQPPLFRDLYDRATTILRSDPNILSVNEYTQFNETAPRPLDSWPIYVRGLGVNLRNAYQEGDDDTPLQFQYQAADCRLFYTLENIWQPATMWQAANEAIWGGRGCVKGSTGGKGSLANRGGGSSKNGGSEGGNDKDGKGKKNSGERLRNAPLRTVLIMVIVGIILIH